MNTVGGVMFIHNGEEFDYCFRECIASLKACCDQVVILDAGSTDGSQVVCKSFEDYKTKVICLPEEAWHAQQGREKLAYFQNEAKKHLDTTYQLLVQGDEVLHERSFQYVRDAVNTGLPAFMCSRYNLWFDPWHQLNVEQERKPCSSEVIRLAKVEYDSVNDGENIDCPRVCFDLMDKIEIFHLGYVRKPDVMKRKVIHMLEKVFLTPHDARLDKSDVFDPWEYFRRDDVINIQEPLPRFVQAWVQERYPSGSLLSSQ